jgi:hypothetical protein
MQLRLLRVIGANSLKITEFKELSLFFRPSMKGGEYLAEMIENNIAVMSRYLSE